jgi:hypothetical protein
MSFPRCMGVVEDGENRRTLVALVEESGLDASLNYDTDKMKTAHLLNCQTT